MAKHHPTTPSVAGLTERKADIALVTSSPAIAAWEAVRGNQFAAFELLGQSGANGAVSLLEVAQGFAAGVAAATFQPDNARDCYAAYCRGWNVAMAAKPENVRGKLKPTEGDSFDASLSQFATFGTIGAVAQGVFDAKYDAAKRPLSCEWLPSFYDRIAAIYSATADDDAVDSLYSAQVACNRIARDYGKQNTGRLWDVQQVTDEEIAAACVKAKNNTSQFARIVKLLDSAKKAAAKLSPEMAEEIGQATLDCGAIWQTMESARLNEARGVELLKAAALRKYEQEAIANEAAKQAAE